MSPGGARLPVHDRDVWLFVIKELLPQALGQKVHTLLLHGPAGERARGAEVWDLLGSLRAGNLDHRAPVETSWGARVRALSTVSPPILHGLVGGQVQDSLSFFRFPLRARLAEPHDAEEKQMLRKGRHLPKVKQQGSSRAGLPGQAV